MTNVPNNPSGSTSTGSVSKGPSNGNNQGSNAMNWIPQTLNGRYNIKEELGSGGFGITFLAEDTKNNLKFVIKTIKPEKWNAPNIQKLVNELRNELLTTNKLAHINNVVRIIDWFDENDLKIMGTNIIIKTLPCLVMEYVEGTNLFEYVNKNQKFLSEKEALNYIIPIGKALIQIHDIKYTRPDANGVVETLTLIHRDIKPKNIILCNDGTVILIDFGIARYVDEKQANNLTKYVSPGYSPIEQYYDPISGGTAQGTYSDVYGLAATFYFLLTKKQPHEAPYRSVQIAMTHRDPLTEPKQHNPQISDRVNDAIIKGMAIAHGDRYQTVQEFLDALLNTIPKKPQTPPVNTPQPPINTPQPPINPPVNPNSNSPSSGGNSGLKLVLLFLLALALAVLGPMIYQSLGAGITMIIIGAWFIIAVCLMLLKI